MLSIPFTDAKKCLWYATFSATMHKSWPALTSIKSGHGTKKQIKIKEWTPTPICCSFLAVNK